MTVNAIIAGPAGIAVAADGVALDASTKAVAGFGAKIIGMPERTSLLLCRGPAGLGTSMQEQLKAVGLGAFGLSRRRNSLLNMPKIAACALHNVH